MSYVEHDQGRYPLATLVIESSKRERAQRIRLLALARQVSRERECSGIPSIER